MIDMLHWVAQADPADLNRAVPVFVAAYAAAAMHLTAMIQATWYLRR